MQVCPETGKRIQGRKLNFVRISHKIVLCLWKRGSYNEITLESDLFLRVSLAVVFANAMGIRGTWLAWPVGWIVGTGLSVVFYWTAIRPMADKETTL